MHAVPTSLGYTVLAGPENSRSTIRLNRNAVTSSINRLYAVSVTVCFLGEPVLFVAAKFDFLGENV